MEHDHGLPEHVRSLFWEYDADVLRLDTDRDLIVDRVLSAGNWQAISWLRRQLGDAALRAWLLHHDGGNLSPRQLRFWELVLELPASRVDGWIAARKRTSWSRRTAS